MEFGSFDRKDGGGHKGVDLLDIQNIFIVGQFLCSARDRV